MNRSRRFARDDTGRERDDTGRVQDDRAESPSLIPASLRSSDHRNLSPRIASAMAEEEGAIAERTQIAHGHVPDAECLQPLVQHTSHVNRSGGGDTLARKRLVNLRSHLVAPAADGRSQMHVQLGSRSSCQFHRTHARLFYPRSDTAPTRVKNGRRSPGVRHEDRRAVRDRDRHGHRLLAVNVAVRTLAPQPALPSGPVTEYSRPMHL